MLYGQDQISANICEEQRGKEISDLLQIFLEVYNQTGYLIFQVYQNSILYGRLPVANARITLCRCVGNGSYVCKVMMTDIDGKTEPIAVPTTTAELYQSPEAGISRCTYDISVEAPGFKRYEQFNIPVYSGITSIQNIELLPEEQEAY